MKTPPKITFAELVFIIVVLTVLALLFVSGCGAGIPEEWVDVLVVDKVYEEAYTEYYTEYISIPSGDTTITIPQARTRYHPETWYLVLANNTEGAEEKKWYQRSRIIRYVSEAKWNQFEIGKVYDRESFK